MIARITHACTRRYRDNGSTVAFVEWVDTRGVSGRTEGRLQRIAARKGKPEIWTFGEHMHALFARAKREGIRPRRETWAA